MNAIIECEQRIQLCVGKPVTSNLLACSGLRMDAVVPACDNLLIGGGDHSADWD
jgi:hypothetical protein